MADDSAAYDSIHSRPSGWNYFDLNDILVCQEKIPCTFQTQLRDLGFLDPGSDSDHLEKGTRMELPFWLAQELCARQRRIVSVEIPKPYRETYRQIFEADAVAVDLNKLGPYFYAFGGKLLGFDGAENSRIAESMLSTFMKRMRRLMDLSLNKAGGSRESQTTLSKLDRDEHNIFTVAQEGLAQFEQWKLGITSKLTTSKTVVNHRKRKRTEEN